VGHTYRELVPGGNWEYWVPRFADVALSGEPARLQEYGAGSRRHLDVYAYCPQAGRFAAVMGDVTGRRRAEEALRESEERYRTLFESMTEGFALGETVLDADGNPHSFRFLAVNPAFEKQMGIKAEDIIGRTTLEVFYDPGPVWFERYGTLVRTGEPVRFQERLGPLGRWFEVRAFKVDERRFATVFLDITERKQAEEALRKSEERFRSLAENVPSVLMRYDRDLRIVYLSPQAEDVIGIPIVKLIGKTNRKVGMPEETCRLWEDAIKKVFVAGRETSLECDFPAEGGKRIFYLKLAPELGADGTTEHVLGIATEITELKRAEEQLERLRSEFFGVISHELKTPLTAIKGSASMALSPHNFPVEEEARELFEVINEQSDRLTDLVNNLLDMTRIEAGTFSVDRREVDLAEVITDAVRTFERAGFEHRIDMRVVKELPRVEADRRRVVQVFTNLLTNAAKFSASHLPIAISAKESGDWVVVSVRDRGAGISPEKLPLLFKKFSQSPQVSGKGTGLGLWISESIIAAHGGRIWVESAGPNKGATFSFTLPKLGVLEPRDAQAVASLRVLAADDEPSILRFVERFLTIAGHRVVTTTDPFLVRDLVETGTPDVLVLDMKMPGKSGIEILREIREFSQVPVVVITATDNEKEVMEARRYSGVSWLPKPFAPEELLEHVQAAARQSRRTRP
jgi:PAS domain S-box-containing protein